MARLEVTKQDAVVAIMVVDASQGCLQVSSADSAIYSSFPDNPDADLATMERKIDLALGRTLLLPPADVSTRCPKEAPKCVFQPPADAPRHVGGPLSSLDGNSTRVGQANWPYSKGGALTSDSRQLPKSDIPPHQPAAATKRSWVESSGARDSDAVGGWDGGGQASQGLKGRLEDGCGRGSGGSNSSRGSSGTHLSRESRLMQDLFPEDEQEVHLED
eukprot:gene25580-11232_t